MLHPKGSYMIHDTRGIGALRDLAWPHLASDHLPYVVDSSLVPFITKQSSLH